MTTRQSLSLTVYFVIENSNDRWLLSFLIVVMIVYQQFNGYVTRIRKNTCLSDDYWLSLNPYINAYNKELRTSLSTHTSFSSINFITSSISSFFFETTHVAAWNDVMNRAVFQLYPETTQQMEMITNAAMKCGFSGGVVIDYPNSTKARKYYSFTHFITGHEIFMMHRSK
jgi:hypothetical protein